MRNTLLSLLGSLHCFPSQKRERSREDRLTLVDKTEDCKLGSSRGATSEISKPVFLDCSLALRFLCFANNVVCSPNTWHFLWPFCELFLERWGKTILVALAGTFSISLDGDTGLHQERHNNKGGRDGEDVMNDCCANDAEKDLCM